MSIISNIKIVQEEEHEYVEPLPPNNLTIISQKILNNTKNEYFIVSQSVQICDIYMMCK